MYQTKDKPKSNPLWNNTTLFYSQENQKTLPTTTFTIIIITLE